MPLRLIVVNQKLSRLQLFLHVRTNLRTITNHSLKNQLATSSRQNITDILYTQQTIHTTGSFVIRYIPSHSAFGTIASSHLNDHHIGSGVRFAPSGENGTYAIQSEKFTFQLSSECYYHTKVVLQPVQLKGLKLSGGPLGFTVTLYLLLASSSSDCLKPSIDTIKLEFNITENGMLFTAHLPLKLIIAPSISPK